MFDAFNENLLPAKNNNKVKNFIVTFDFINYVEIMIIKLNNKFFIHLLNANTENALNADTKNKLIIAKSVDSFAYISIERYTNKKFYNVMINIEASNYSIANYDQYLIYKTIENVNIDKSKTNIINV